MSEETISTTDAITIYVRLFGEGTDVFRPTKGFLIGTGIVQLLATDDYDPEIEDWEFKPGSVVRIEKRRFQSGKEEFLAVSLAAP